MIFRHPGVIAAFSRQPQNMSFKHGDTQNSLANRQGFLSSLGIAYRDLACANQVHEDAVACVRQEDKGKGALDHQDAFSQTDALITRERDVPLAVFTADCLSVFLYDPVKQVAGVAHAGWRSSRKRIVEKTARLMAKEFNSQAIDIMAGFGPAIGPCCYEVGAEFRDYFDYGITQRQGKYYLDLAQVNRSQLIEAGLKEENISSRASCTFCSKDFFSYRRQGSSCGRMMSVIMLK